MTTTGPMANLLHALADSLNFTYSVVQGDGYWGAPQGNGSWNGMIGLVLRKEADLGLGPFGVTFERSQVVGFTWPVFREVLHVLVPRPRPQPQPWQFLAPFTLVVWVCVLASLVVVTGAALLVETVNRGVGEGTTHRGVISHLITHFQIFLSQSVKWEGVGEAGRAVTAVWLIAVLVVMRTYSGALTSLLAVKKVGLKYDSLKDALADPRLTLVMEGSTALTAYLKSAKSGVYGELARAVGERGLQVKASQMQEAAYTLLPQGGHAMFLERIGCNKVYSDHFSKTGRCDFYLSRGVFWPLLYSVVVPRHHPLGILVDARILALRGFGVYKVWTQMMTPNITHCLRMPTTLKYNEPFALRHLWAVFLFLAGGLVAALIIFASELALG
ncbi:hypothetical protein Pcinc_026557 [Petrolisthes cinctipes]|uniref:Glutamate receptor n=1 Tax=Petrolisthes cinctipes TaxID=88211 RepID=A0AAE1K7Z0_PETCI|nr:hypothetical protein Pcinc_026557 [Petrolisthes cinctipes]